MERSTDGRLAYGQGLVLGGCYDAQLDLYYSATSVSRYRRILDLRRASLLLKEGLGEQVSVFEEFIITHDLELPVDEDAD
jgi:hypothetical protein